MLTPWLSNPAFEKVLQSASDACGIDLVKYGTESDADTIRDTAVAQPLIVAAGLASLAAMQDQVGFPITSASAVAGHSVGEITAAIATGVLSLEDGMKLVEVRANEMARAASSVATGMAAVLGGNREDVIAALDKLELVAANENGANQIVAAGSIEVIEELVANPPAGTRVRQLQVAGAFHTYYMSSAQEEVIEVVKHLTISDPSLKLVSNKAGEVVTSGEDFIDKIVGQVASPVRWDLCMETFTSMGITGLIELFPGGTLTGIAKRALPGVELLSISSVDDIQKVAEFVAKHSEVNK
jgi:[acyl-carrier-protein] S-malonyltransferase